MFDMPSMLLGAALVVLAYSLYRATEKPWRRYRRRRHGRDHLRVDLTKGVEP